MFPFEKHHQNVLKIKDMYFLYVSMCNDCYFILIFSPASFLIQLTWKSLCLFENTPFQNKIARQKLKDFCWNWTNFVFINCFLKNQWRHVECFRSVCTKKLQNLLILLISRAFRHIISKQILNSSDILQNPKVRSHLQLPFWIVS